MRKLIRFLTAAVTAGAALACGDSTGGGDGRLAVQLTDTPFPYAEVSRVDIFVVRVDARAPSTGETEAADAASRSGWVTIAEPNTAFNLLDLQGGKTANLGVTSLATGTYNGFRLVLDTQKSSVTLKTGTVLKGNTNPGIIFPSAAQTGVKINLDAPIQVTRDSSLMILDFDVGRSFVQRGNSIGQNGLLFKPVIRAIAKELTGSVSGSVHANTATGTAVAGAAVDILKAGTALTDTVSANVVRTTSTDASGNFRLSFVLPGTYVLRATPSAASGYKPALLPGGLVVSSGSEASGKVIVVTP